ncbi:hypothetical protein K469DRAFT_360730 [Zopfia rhizophila CBS 207.26]|uniref:Uncharacterized protein n=1 Tax=Zopfia rhizophila CBS 207.26 TaxID=1314779 RepID=A0A6A6ELH6_9PEZI|nr:hypothetical protein K469DRAFT_360730 [Zopfia rhizophila CBS 207.26]
MRQFRTRHVFGLFHPAFLKFHVSGMVSFLHFCCCREHGLPKPRQSHLCFHAYSAGLGHKDVRIAPAIVTVQLISDCTKGGRVIHKLFSIYS